MNGPRALVVLGGFALACGAHPVAPPAAPSLPPAPRECVELPRDTAVEDAPPLTHPLAVYEERARAHPSDLATQFELLLAYEREERWLFAAAIAWRLSQLEPGNADYQHHRGLNLVRAFEVTDVVQLGEAEQALEKCIEVEPKLADCHFLLGDIALWTDEETVAEERYRKAIELDPKRAVYYQRLAGLYAAYRQDRAAAEVLSEALRFIRESSRFPLLISLADLTAKNGDPERALSYLAQAEPLAEAGPAPLSFELAGAYANMDPPVNSEGERKIVALMRRFHEGACHGDSEIKYREQCIQARVWVMTYAP